jgi:hypothetical protein
MLGPRNSASAVSSKLKMLRRQYTPDMSNMLEKEKVSNTLLYYRYALRHNIGGLRVRYAVRDVDEHLRDISYWRRLSEEEKKYLREQFRIWKANPTHPDDGG